jgi:hypothetical protein
MKTALFEIPEKLASVTASNSLVRSSSLEQESVRRDPWHMPDSDIEYTKMGPEGLCDWMKRHKCRAFFLSLFLAAGLFCAVYLPLSNIKTLTLLCYRIRMF